MELNLYELNDKERIKREIDILPSSLEQAIIYAEDSDLVKETLGPHSFRRFIALKKSECEEYNRQVTDYEIKKYFPIL
jgi:glutamine synthetase